MFVYILKPCSKLVRSWEKERKRFSSSALVKRIRAGVWSSGEDRRLYACDIEKFEVRST